MNSRVPVIGLVVLGALALLALGFFSAFEQREETEYTRARAEALSNPLLALELTLGALGEDAKSLSSLPPMASLGVRDRLLIDGDLDHIEPAEATAIAHWVRAGGELVLAPGTEVRASLIEALGVLDATVETKDGCVLLAIADAAAHAKPISWCGPRYRLAPGFEPEASIGNAADGWWLVRVKLGAGHVTLFSDFAPLTRRALGEAANRELALRALALRPAPVRTASAGRAKNRLQHTTWLVYALDGPGFLSVLVQRGWPALLALTLLLAAWVAWVGARLGPLLPAPVPRRRALLEHVAAAGEYLYRHDAGRSLHQFACEAVLARLKRHDPAAAGLGGEALYRRLAEHAGLDPGVVAQAFATPAQPRAFVAAITTLARLGSRS